jgi:hypothetical protein
MKHIIKCKYVVGDICKSTVAPVTYQITEVDFINHIVTLQTQKAIHGVKFKYAISFKEADEYVVLIK